MYLVPLSFLSERLDLCLGGIECASLRTFLNTKNLDMMVQINGGYLIEKATWDTLWHFQPKGHVSSPAAAVASSPAEKIDDFSGDKEAGGEREREREKERDETWRLFFAGESLDSSASPTLVHGIHVFHCPDATGIVSKISECIASRGANILSADIFVPDHKQVFYSRSGFVFDSAKWPRIQMEDDFQKLSKMFNALKSVVRVPAIDPKYKIAVLASKQDHCLVDLLHGWQDGKLPLDIACVISNHDRGPNTHVMRFLERHKIPYHYIHTTEGEKREAEILDLVRETDFLVLARYMQILSGNFLSSYGKDVINIHHGLLPSFKGGRPSKQAFEAGVKLIGATSHFVTEELDAGPIIEQMVERVSHRDNLQSFIQKSENLEKQCLAKAIKSYCELRVLPYDVNRTVIF